MAHPDYVIAGAGIIGLTLALELHSQGASVTVLEAAQALGQTSVAAAGMLAVNDPLNPAQLLPLTQLSASLYPAFLDRLADLSGLIVPFQTSSTLQASADPHPGILRNPRQLLPQLTPGDLSFRLLDEHSIDPRQLATALLAAIRTTDIQLLEHTALTRIAASPRSIHIETTSSTLDTAFLIDCMGTWSPAPVFPRKGQMLAVKMPRGFELESVVRTEEVYLVPRTQGPHLGRLLIGATLEDAGFDLEVHARDLLTLNAHALELFPALANAEFLDSWAGLRPATADGLPLLGNTPEQPHYVLATGHFRNGILLAPATARVLAQLLSGVAPEVDLRPFQPDRPSLKQRGIRTA